ncbi:hypothetical protein [Candidatus Uabimicrobium sp. HlEnr_7]|uniref:hypothetical protein n=1 Tax=Candidatus Uabimicrobium helgolandensis TaxID=3095367 RepID=UPI0035582209
MKWLCVVMSLTFTFAQIQNEEVLQLLGEQNSEQFHKPYPLAILYQLVDMPYHQVYERVLRAQFEDRLSNNYENFYNAKYYHTALTKRIIEASSVKDIPKKMLSTLKQEHFLAIEIHGYDRYFVMRAFCPKTRTFSPIVRRSFNSNETLAKDICSIIPQIFGIEGIVVKKEEEHYLFLRGNNTTMRSILKSGGHTFYLYRQNARIVNTYAQIGELLSVGTFVYSKIDVLGDYKLRGFETAQKIYFTGGFQKIKLINHEEQSQEAFSIFTSYEGFSDNSKNYRGTTDISGSFKIEDTEKAPIFLMIMKNMNNVNFPIVRRHIIVENNSATLKLVAQTLEEVEAISKRKLSQRQLLQIKNEVVQRILQAKNYMKLNDFEKAIISLEYAKKLTQKMNKEPSLQNALTKLENVYQQALKQKKMNRNKKEAIALLKKTDKKVSNFFYKEALELAKKAQRLWPFANDENKGYQEILKRLKKIEILLLQENTSFGEARLLLSKTLFSFNSDNITIRNIETIHGAVKILNTPQKHQEIYNDRYILTAARSFLDKLASDLITIANFHLEKYKNNENTNERREAYKNYEKYYNSSKKIDVILSELQKI